jgi:methylene-fatty-acyl-phospholipid synthase
MDALVRMLPLAAFLLAMERFAHVLVWRHPEGFEALCRHRLVAPLGDAVDVLQRAFCGFKLIQGAVFVAWCFVFDDAGPVPTPTTDALALVAGGLLCAFGQALNVSVFATLGKIGVFYGNRFGHEVPWQAGFPCSAFPHPQYLGAALTVWGVFLIMRFPEPDWLVLPLLSTVYYLIGARLER